jgi:beta-lactamase superfamily II metal-dependent hydrolase
MAKMDAKDTKSSASTGMDVRADDAPPAWTPGAFQVLFFSMGQGDCCVVTCPDGKHLMIDCGIKSQEKDVFNQIIQVQQILRSKDVLNLNDSEKGVLEALILTHPDEDHINKVQHVLGGQNYQFTDTKEVYKFGVINVKKVYFSDSERNRFDYKSGPLRKYGSGCNETIYGKLSVQELNCVTLNGTTKSVDTWAAPFGEKNHAARNLTDDFVTVHKADNDSWSVSIIAGNVVKENGDKSDGDGRNAASLVTLLKIGKEKILICGDATSSTENYLRTKFPRSQKGTKNTKNTNFISDLNLIQVPHHGSDTTSSTQAFVDVVRPKSAAISVQKFEHSHHLPGKAVIERYMKYAEQDDVHPSAGWVQDGKPSQYETYRKNWEEAQKAKKISYIVEVNDNKEKIPVRMVLTQVLTQIDKNRSELQNLNDNYKGIRIISGRSYEVKHFLYQEPIQESIRQTGIDGHLWYYFDGTGTDT